MNKLETLESKKKELKKEIIKLNDEIKATKKEYKSGKFNIVERLKKEEDYYSIVELFEVDPNCEYFDLVDNIYYKDLNYFHTKEEAKKYADNIKLTLKILRARDKARDNWIPDDSKGEEEFYELLYKFNEFDVRFGYISPFSRTHLTFKDQEQIDLFRKLVTDEEIIKFLEI